MKKFVLTLSLLAATCISQAQSKSNQQLEEARKAIIASNAIYSDLANKGDGSILTRYTDDACLLPPNSAPVCGRDNILNFFKSGPKVRSIFTIQNIYGDGNDFVTEESRYELFDMDNKKLDEGKVMVIWKKTKEGWKMYRDMFSSNHALNTKDRVNNPPILILSQNPMLTACWNSSPLTESEVRASKGVMPVNFLNSLMK